MTAFTDNANTPILVSSILSLVLILSLGGHAYSQMLPPGFQMPQMPKTVQGKYVNPEFGLEMVLAEGIEGFESSNVGSTVVTITLGDPSTAQVVNGTTIIDLPIMTLTMSPPPLSKVNDTVPLATSNSSLTSAQPTSEDMGCKTLSTESTNVGGKNAQVYVRDCIVGLGTLIKEKRYTIDAGDAGNVLISYRTPSPTKYDLNIGTFEEIVKTIKFSK